MFPFNIPIVYGEDFCSINTAEALKKVFFRSDGLIIQQRLCQFPASEIDVFTTMTFVGFRLFVVQAESDSLFQLKSSAKSAVSVESQQRFQLVQRFETQGCSKYAVISLSMSTMSPVMWQQFAPGLMPFGLAP